jgi:hypothetical protein
MNEPDLHIPWFHVQINFGRLRLPKYKLADTNLSTPRNTQHNGCETIRYHPLINN